MKYRKKPVIIEAVRWYGDKSVLPEGWPGGFPNVAPDGRLFIGTREGAMVANPGDWIIKGVAGEFYPCKPDIFKLTYEEVNP